MNRLTIFLTASLLFLTACGRSEVSETPTAEPAQIVTETKSTDEARYFDPLVHDWPHDISDIKPDSDVVYGKLDNGLRYVLRKNTRPEGEAVLRFWIKAGSKNETKWTLGAAHFLEHMAFNGSENIPEGEMVKSLERRGLSFGTDTNASTTFTRTEYRLNLPEVDDETVDYALFLMRETADKLTIDSDAVIRERAVVKAEEALGNTPGRKAARAYNDFIYPHALSRARPVIGTPETLDRLDARYIRDFYATYYRPERSVIVMVGDFNIETMRGKIETTFSDWVNTSTVPDEPDDGYVSGRTPAAKVYQDDELTTQVVMFDASPSSYQVDSRSARRENFIRNYANAIVNQRISKKLLDSDAPILSGGISYSSRKLGDQATASFSAKDNNWEAGMALLDAEIRTALEYGFQQSEYDELLSNSRRGLLDAVNYAGKRHSNSLAAGIMGAFSGASVLTTPKDRLFAFENHVLDISLKELEAAFKDMWWDFDPLVWLEGPKLEDVNAEAVLEAYQRIKTQDIAAPATREKLSFAYNDFGTPGKIVWQNTIKDFDIDQVRFANNVRVNLKKTDFEDDWIRISVTVGEGWNAFPANKPGLTTLASAFVMGGYEAHKANELSQIFAGKSVGLNFTVGSERLSMSGATNPTDLEDQMKAWTALLTAPGYRPEWQEKYAENIENSFHTIDATPGGVASRDLGRIWTNGDRRFGLLEKSEYLDYTLDDVREIFDPILNSGAIEIGVVGDFNKEDVLTVIAKTFGALPKRKANFDLKLEAFAKTFPAANSLVLTHTGAANQGAIYLAWPTHENWTLNRSRHYAVLQKVMQNRMTEKIREDLGLSYSPSAGLNFSKYPGDYGYTSASIQSDPQFFDQFEEAAIEIAAELKTGGITEDEVHRAVQPILETFQRGERENSTWLGPVTRSQTDPTALDYRRSRTEAFTNITATDLNTYAAELFDPSTLHTVKILPQDSDQ